MRRNGVKRGAIIVIMLVAWLLAATATANTESLLVDTAFVRERLEQKDWIVVDMRTPDEYEAGHIPGAVLLPGWISSLYATDSKRSATVIPRLEQQFGEMGIGDDSHVIVYGNPARTSWNGVMFWVLELSGCNSEHKACTVRFYDGGIERWQEEGGELAVEPRVPAPATFSMKPGTGRGAVIDEVRKVSAGEQKAAIIDVRSFDEFTGVDIRALRGGHIPGAVNIPYQENYDPDSFTMLPREKLRPLYGSIAPDQRVITHCQTGQRAAYSYLVLRVLGYRDVAIYHDGWRVYGSNLTLPAEDETWFDFTTVNRAIQQIERLQDALE